MRIEPSGGGLVLGVRAHVPAGRAGRRPDERARAAPVDAVVRPRDVRAPAGPAHEQVQAVAGDDGVRVGVAEPAACAERHGARPGSQPPPARERVRRRPVAHRARTDPRPDIAAVRRGEREEPAVEARRGYGLLWSSGSSRPNGRDTRRRPRAEVERLDDRGRRRGATQPVKSERPAATARGSPKYGPGARPTVRSAAPGRVACRRRRGSGSRAWRGAGAASWAWTRRSRRAGPAPTPPGW